MVYVGLHLLRGRNVPSYSAAQTIIGERSLLRQVRGACAVAEIVRSAFSETAIRNSYDVIFIFQDGGRQPYRIISRLLQTTHEVQMWVPVRSSNFDSIGFIVSEMML